MRGGARAAPGCRRSGRGEQTIAPRVWRIRDRGTFEELRRRGRRIRQGPVSLTWLPDAAGSPPRVAYAIGKRFGPAVARNRMRRRLRAVVQEQHETIPPGAYLIGASPAAADLTHAELSATVAGALAQLPGAQA